MTYAIVYGSFMDGEDGVGTCSYCQTGIESLKVAENLLKQYKLVADPTDKYWIVEENQEKETKK